MWFILIHSPDFMNAKLYSEGIKKELKKCIEFMEKYKDGETENNSKDFSDFEIKKVPRLIDWIDASQILTSSIAMKNFYKFLIEHDLKKKNKLT